MHFRRILPQPPFHFNGNYAKERGAGRTTLKCISQGDILCICTPVLVGMVSTAKQEEEDNYVAKDMATDNPNPCF